MLTRHIARGFSMEPFLLDGDEILVKNCLPESCRIGDILLYQSPDHARPVAHRLIKKMEPSDIFILRPDALPEILETIEGKSILGKVVGAKRNGSIFDFNSKNLAQKLSHPFIIFGYGRLVDLKNKLVHFLLPVIGFIQGLPFYQKLVSRILKPVFTIDRIHTEEIRYEAVAKIHGRQAGRADFIKESQNKISVLWISALSIRVRYRGAGIASGLLREIENFSRQERMDELRLTLEPGNRAAQRLYEKMGFEKITEEGLQEDSKILLRKAL